MKQIVYYSTALRLFSDEELLAMLEPARATNSKAGVTGMLLYVDGNFVQALEGPDRTLDKLFAKIAMDPRHYDVLKAFDMPIRTRSFSDWTMGFRKFARIDTVGTDGLNEFLTQPSRTEGGANGAPTGAALRLLDTFKRVVAIDQQLRWA